MKRSTLSIGFLTMIIALAFADQSFAQAYQTVEDADIHEGFVTRVTGNILIDAHPQQPPAPIRERIPRQTDESAIWLGGYWAWSDSKQDYIWTSGVWRRPPPGHQWIEGFWKEYDDGWSWIPGFWSDKDQADLSYIDLAPPEAIDENVPSSPQDDYFWNSGFWWYNANKDEYEWVDGQWEQLDPNWVLIPAHYTWRPEGYVFIDAYWDWPLDALGEAYEPVYIPPAQRETIIYEPVRVVEATYIIDHYFYTYPDYTCFYYHHFHYNPWYWENYCCAPQWWLWDSWWGLSWSNQWGLWWWYSNPGYPAPFWITSNISAILPPPGPALFNRMKRVRPPKFITPNGIVSPNAILRETERVSGDRRPILPPGRKDREKIWKGVKPKGTKDLRPSGRPRPFDPNVRRPGPRKPNIDREPGARVPRVPEGRGPRIPKRPDRPGRPRPEYRPDYRVPGPGAQQPPSRRPDYGRPPRPGYRPDQGIPPSGRPPRPGYRPDDGRPDFGRPPVQRPSRPRPDLDRPGSSKPDFDRPPGRRPSKPRPDLGRPGTRKPDTRVPETKVPDYTPPSGRWPSRPEIDQDDIRKPQGRRPSKPRPEIDRDDFRKPQGRRPSQPRPEIDRDDFRKPQTIHPDYQPADRQPKVFYPPGFRDRPKEEIQRQPQQFQPRGNQPSETPRFNQKKRTFKRYQQQEIQFDRRGRGNDDDD